MRGVDLLRGDAERGTLTVSVTPAFATRWLVPRLGGRRMAAALLTMCFAMVMVILPAVLVLEECKHYQIK